MQHTHIHKYNQCISVCVYFKYLLQMCAYLYKSTDVLKYIFFTIINIISLHLPQLQSHLKN